MRSSCVRAPAQAAPIAIASNRPADRLRALARDVRRMGDAYRRDPESIALEKDEIASELLSLARRLDGGRP